MAYHQPSAVEAAVGGSGGKPGRCFASVAGPQADDTRALAIVLGTTRSTINTLRTPMDREQVAPKIFASEAHITANQIHSSILKRRGRSRGFTLAEILVSMGVLVLLVLLFTQLLNSTATITILEYKRMDADSEARQVFDRMAIDFAQMVKRTDVDYFAKNTVAPNSVGGSMTGNDQIAFFSAAPGYYPSTGSQSPVSLVAYRVNAQHQLERMGVGLVWNAVSPTDTPVVFMPLTISATWPSATDLTASPTPEPRAEVIGPNVFRFEYYYLVTTATAPFLTYLPCNGVGCNSNGWGSVVAIVVDIAVIDPKSKVLLTDQQIATIIGNTSLANNSLADFGTQSKPGFINLWQNRLNNIINPNSPFFISTLPRQAVTGIRVYERYFYLNL